MSPMSGVLNRHGGDQDHAGQQRHIPVCIIEWPKRGGEQRTENRQQELRQQQSAQYGTSADAEAMRGKSREEHDDAEDRQGENFGKRA